MYIHYLKRIFDFILSIFGILLLIPLLIIIGLAIMLEDRGPIFYVAERIGKNGKPFKMYKFRSMKVNSTAIFNPDGSTHNDRNDPRVTRIGKYLRATSIDEIPQFINVLKGDMSIIGPRASLYSVLETFREDEIGKMDVRPGITGYTQAYYRNSLSSREKRLKDAWYARNVNLLLDMRIFIKTISTVIKQENLYTQSVVVQGNNESDTLKG